MHREQTPADEKKALVEQLVHKQHLTELKSVLERLHPADIAYVLEALPHEERLLVWDWVKAEPDGAILLEVSEPVRETLIESMDARSWWPRSRARRRRPRGPRRRPAGRSRRGGRRRPDAGRARAVARRDVLSGGDSVGARMDFDLVTVREDVTLEVVLRYLRRFDELPQHTDQVFVVDRYDVLKGACRSTSC